MKVTLKNASQVNLMSAADLQSLVPLPMDGEALNYGQGEGQFRVGNSVWGIYVNKDGVYSYAHEEGVLELEQIVKIAVGILERIRIRWGAEIEGEVRGCHHGDGFIS